LIYADDKYNETVGIFDLNLSLEEYLDTAPDDWKSGVRTTRRS